jgi:hypothetical protein
MSGKMYLLYAEKTGNVLAAVSANTPSDGTVLPDALVGTGLMLRNLFDPNAKRTWPGKIAVPVADLAVAEADPDERELGDPLGWRIGEDKSPTELTAGPFATMALAVRTVTISVPIAASAVTPVQLWVQNASAGEAHATGIAVSAKTVTVLLTGAIGTYNALCLVQGYPPIVQTLVI